jgi:hypothetical protein
VESVEGLKDRSSRPHRLRHPTPAAIVQKLEALRGRRFTGKQIAAEFGISPATVSRILRRLGLNRIRALEPAEPVQLPIWLQRYNWHRPHGSLKSKPPISRLALAEDNLLRGHT